MKPFKIILIAFMLFAALSANASPAETTGPPETATVKKADLQKTDCSVMSVSTVEVICSEKLEILPTAVTRQYLFSPPLLSIVNSDITRGKPDRWCNLGTDITDTTFTGPPPNQRE